MSDDAPERVDVLRYGPDGGADDGVYRAVGAGYGPRVVEAHEDRARSRRVVRLLLVPVAVVVAAGVAVLTGDTVAYVAGGLAVALVVGAVLAAPTPTTPEVVDRNLALDRAERRYDLDTVVDDPTGG